MEVFPFATRNETKQNPVMNEENVKKKTICDG